MTSAQTTPAEQADTFQYFAQHRAAGYAPLYAQLATAIADDPTLLAIAALARPGQSTPDLLLAAVHDLLHDHRAHPAARFYPSLTDHPDVDDDPAPVVLGFCHEHLDDIAERVATRLVQTNEVRRCTFLTPALLAAARLAQPAPLALIEVGAAAGLNLLFDHYSYRYSGPDWHTEITGTPGAPVLDCTLTGPLHPPVTDSMPQVAWRAGIDLNPLNPADPADRQWLTALVWPDHAERAARLTHALDAAASHPTQIHPGDAVDVLPRLAEQAPPQTQLVIYHCAVLAHTPPAARARFTDVLLDISNTRLVLWIQAEPRPDNDPRRLRLTICANGQISADHPLGRYHPHGEWLDWCGDHQLSQ